MRVKPENTWRAIFIVVVVFALIAVARFIGIGTTRSATTIGYVEKGKWHEWSASYTILNGTLQHTLRPASSDNLLHVNVKTESGTFSIEVKNTDGYVIFQQENLDTKEFDVEVAEKVSVIIHAKEHKGSFAFNFTSSSSID